MHYSGTDSGDKCQLSLVVDAQFFGHVNRAIHKKLLIAVFLSTYQRNARWRHAQIICEQPNYLFVGIAISWRGRCPDSKPAVIHTQNFVATGSCLHANTEQEIFAAPLGTGVIPGCQIGSGL